MGQQSLKDKTAKGLFWGGFSNGMQQLLNLLFGIITARILNATDYGMVGMLTIFSAIAATLQESGFTVALANKRKVTHEDYNAVFWFSLLAGISLYLILFFSAPLIANFYNKPELVPLARFVFLGFLFSSTSTAHNAVLFRNLMVKQRAMSQIPSLAVSGIVGVLLAYNGMSYWGIASQSLVYIMLVNLSYWYYSPWRPTWKIDFRPLKEMFGFSSKILLTNVFTQTSNNLLSTLLGRYYSTNQVGYYSQSGKWNTMGYSLINGMINSVAQPILAEVSQERERQLNVFRKMLRFTAFLTFPCMLGLLLVSRELIIITITDKWLPCVPILQILCIWGAFVPITTLFSNLVISKGKSNIFMWNTIIVGILLLSTMIMVHSYGITTMLVCFVSINIGWLFVWQYFAWKLIRLNLWTTLKDVLPFACIASLTMVISYFITQGIGNIYLLFGAKIIISITIYTFILWIVKATILKECVAFLAKRLKVKEKK